VDDHSLNVGNALGAWIGGLTLAAGYGFVSPQWVRAVLAVAGLGVAVAGARGGSPSGSGAAAPGVARRAENVGADAFR
jgi:DHA1 family inner membrane transport protein